jgi:cytochrome c peroxidase
LGGSATPLALSPAERTRTQQAFDEFADAIAAYEISSSVSPFTSKFDAYLAGSATLTAQELRGYELFRGKAVCNTCHLDGRSNTAMGTDTGAPTNVAPIFSDFTYNNLGLPRNVILPWYFENHPDEWGFTANPLGIGFVDEGVGLFLDGYYGPPLPPNDNWAQHLPFFEGKFQTSTVRDVGKVPYAGFVKAFMHNGYLLSLKEVVHFYNTRDAFPGAFVAGKCRPGTVEKVNCWPPPEDPNNENMTIGHLGLTSTEENDLVAFLETLTDGFVQTAASSASMPASLTRKPAAPPGR